MRITYEVASMTIKRLTDSLTVSGQLSEEDFLHLSSIGVKTVICNRPDNEDAGQPSFDEVSEIAKKYDISCHFMPIISGRMSIDDGIEFGKLIETITEPVHAYCRSGTRCTTLWAISAIKKGDDINEVLQTAKEAGYDLSGTLGHLN